MIGVCSTVDLIATLLDLCNIPAVSYHAGLPLPPIDGDSLAKVMASAGSAVDDGWKDEALCEYLAHGVISPNAMLRVGRYKLMYSHGDPPVLWDVEADPVSQQCFCRAHCMQTTLDTRCFVSVDCRMKRAIWQRSL